MYCITEEGKEQTCFAVLIFSQQPFFLISSGMSYIAMKFKEQVFFGVLFFREKRGATPQRATI
jgi:hypothetical protein